MSVQIPTRSDILAYTFTTELEGVTYAMSFTWNERMGKWIMGVADNNGNSLVDGVPVIVSYPMLAQYKNPGLPPGILMFIDSSGQDIDPGIDDLGSRVQLQYLTYEESLEALGL